MKHKVITTRNFLYSLLLISLGSNLFYNFTVLNGPKDPTVRFGDLESIFRASNCYKAIGLDVYQDPSSECGYIYGRFFLVLMKILDFGAFGITHYFIIGILQSLLLLIVISLLLWKLNRFENGVIGISAVMFFSPGILFLVERGNLDVIMIFLITLSFLLHEKNALLSWLFLALSASFKFYSVPLLFLSSFLQKNLRTKLVLLILSTTLTVFLTLDLFKFQITFPLSLFLGFGAPLVPGWINLLLTHQNFINFQISGSLGYLISISLVVVLGLFFRKHIQLKRKLILEKDGGRLLKAFIFSATIYTSCYFVGFSYDIRLIYLAASLAILITITESSRRFEFLVYINAFSAFWVGAQFGLNFSSFQKLNVVLQAVGDVSILILTSIVLVVFFKGIDLVALENWPKWKLARFLGKNRNSRATRPLQ